MEGNRKNACCFTGHRIIPREELSDLSITLEKEIRFLAEKGITLFYCGGALGFDTLAAEAVLKIRKEMPMVRLHLALPCPEQTRGWKERDVLRYESIKAQADAVTFVSNEYTKGCMQKRNRYMVDHSALCIAYLLPERSRGGTKYTVAYCEKQGVPVVYLPKKKEQ